MSYLFEISAVSPKQAWTDDREQGASLLSSLFGLNDFLSLSSRSAGVHISRLHLGNFGTIREPSRRDWQHVSVPSPSPSSFHVNDDDDIHYLKSSQIARFTVISVLGSTQKTNTLKSTYKTRLVWICSICVKVALKSLREHRILQTLALGIAQRCLLCILFISAEHKLIRFIMPFNDVSIVQVRCRRDPSESISQYAPHSSSSQDLCSEWRVTRSKDHGAFSSLYIPLNGLQSVLHSVSGRYWGQTPRTADLAIPVISQLK